MTINIIGLPEILNNRIMNKNDIIALKTEATNHLTKELLPFWTIRMKDKKNGGYITHFDEDGKVADSYFFNELYYDSDLERENIIRNIKEVIVFTKIPKNSIKIPVAGGGTYSPDFAYVIKDVKDKRTLHLIVETKGKDEEDLGKTEEKKIAHAQELFAHLSEDVKISFRKQLKGDTMIEIIKGVTKNYGT